MDATQINEVIDNICVKLGMGVEQASQLVPSLAAYKKAECIFLVVFFSVLLIAAIILLIIAICSHDGNSKFHDAIYCSDINEVLEVLMSLTIMGTLVAIPVIVCCHIGWFAAPEVRAIEYILAMLK